MTPAERELRRRYRTAKKDCLHFTAMLIKLMADERWEEVITMAETLGDRATETKLLADGVKAVEGR